MAERIKVYEIIKDKYDYFLDYVTLCGYTYIDEIKPIDYVAVRSKYDLNACDVQELKKYIKEYSNNFVKDLNTNNTCQHTNIICNSDTSLVLDQTSSNNNEIKIKEVPKKSENSYYEIESIENVQSISINNRYKTISLHDEIKKLSLSVRATNALTNANIKIINELLELNEEQLYKIKNIGKTTVDEIMKIVHELNDFYRNETLEINNKLDIKINKSIISYIENIILNENNNETYIDANLNCEVTELLDKFARSINVIGSDIALEAYTYPEKIKTIINIFDDYNKKYNLYKELLERQKKYPVSRQSGKLEYYFMAFGMVDEFKDVFYSFDYDDLKKLNFNDLIKLLKNKNLINSNINFLYKILFHLEISIKIELLNVLRDLKITNTREYSILLKRSYGETLESIGSEFRITRERVRQIEAKCIRYILKKLQLNKDTLMLISADCNFLKIITYSDIIKYFDDEKLARVFNHVFSQKNSSGMYYIFDKSQNLFLYKDFYDKKRADFSKLPDIFQEDDLKSLLEEIAYSQKLDLNKVEFDFLNSPYKKKGKIYYRGQLFKEVLYEYILKKYYPSGIKLYSNETEHFKEKFTEVVGDIELASGRALDTAIARVSVLYDRGTYIHPSYIQIQDDIIDEIDLFISNMNRSVITFNELFNIFKSKLQVGSNVSNRYFLQGVLKGKLSSKYYFNRDYISKDKSVTFTDEIESYIKEHGRVTKSQIMEKFSGITEIMLMMRISNSTDLISLDNGQYVHSNSLNIIEEDYKLEYYIESQISEFPISSKKMISNMLNYYPEFLIRNNINSHSELYGVLKFMFNEKFKFSRPFIAHKDDEDITAINVLKKYLEDYDILSIEELIYICDKNHFSFLSWRNVIRDLNDEFLRVEATKLSRYDNDDFDTEILVGICKAVKDGIGAKGYLAGHKLIDFITYPDVGFAWNSFLLRSIVEKYLSDYIAIIEIPNNDTYTMNSIFINTDSESENYVELCKNILKNEHFRDQFRSIFEAYDWLKDEGLYLGEIPKSLLDNQLICTDEYGSIII